MAKKQHKANLFQFTAYLKQDGNIELNMDGVTPEDLESVMNSGMPEYEGAHSLASLLRYLRSMGNEMLDKSRQYI
jgi:hypothetical protein